jgi:hypothetical protein
MKYLSVLRASIMIMILLIGICPTAPAPTVRSEFSCANIDATTTYYNYLREPKLQESGYTRGLKTGSFNHFKNGDVVLKDTLVYYDGQVADTKHATGIDRNSTVDHNLEVDFIGEAGISEYYAKGFFPSNRAASAFKKIWSIDYTNKDWLLGGIYPSNRIFVKGTAKMGGNRSNNFDFDYNARVANGYLEAKDSLGWSNKTGARMIDWEQEALMKGKYLDVHNRLVVERGRVSGAQLIDDWLPCCFNSFVPAIEPIGDVWPSNSVKAVALKPSVILPTNKCNIHNCTCEDSRCANCTTKENCTNCTTKGNCNDCSPEEVCTTCTQGDCSSFPCIYTYGEEALGAGKFIGAPNDEQITDYFKGVNLESRFVFPLDGNVAEYDITISNTKGKLENAILTLNLAPGMGYILDGTDPQPQNITSEQGIQILHWTWSEILTGEDNIKGVTLLVNTNGHNAQSDLEKTAVQLNAKNVTDNAPIKIGPVTSTANPLE